MLMMLFTCVQTKTADADDAFCLGSLACSLLARPEGCPDCSFAVSGLPKNCLAPGPAKNAFVVPQKLNWLKPMRGSLKLLRSAVPFRGFFFPRPFARPKSVSGTNWALLGDEVRRLGALSGLRGDTFRDRTRRVQLLTDSARERPFKKRPSHTRGALEATTRHHLSQLVRSNQSRAST